MTRTCGTMGLDRWSPSPPDPSAMNLARIHDKHKLRKFWEQKIERHSQMMGNEEFRMKRSALSKLRDEWLQRLQSRDKTVNETLREEQIRKAQRIQELLVFQRGN
ncbi:protein FAM240B [Hoplias malabaricus]|uniref:protein FAM240B n=1 Tax=Hoplias malabaricus TaxID=27720 RepID=UPI003461E289